MADMRLQRVTRDTCPNMATKDACVIEEEWDASVDPSARVHTLVRVLHKCSAHAALDDVSLRDAVVDENVRKNLALSIISNHHAGELNATRLAELMDTVEWSFDESRLLRITVPGAQGPGIAAVQASCNLQFGPDKVIVS